MAVKIDAARLQVYKAAWAKQEHYENGSTRHTLEASIAKLNAGDTAMWVSERAVQVLGGYGYTKDFTVERFVSPSGPCSSSDTIESVIAGPAL